MRNLRLLRNATCEKDIFCNCRRYYVHSKGNITSTCTETRIFLVSNEMKLYDIQLRPSDDEDDADAATAAYFSCTIIADLYPSPPPAQCNDLIVNLSFFTGNVYVVLSTGVIIVVTLSPSSYHSEVVNLRHFNLKLDQVISASWSPDFERNILLSTTGNIYIVSASNSNEYQVIRQLDLHNAAAEEKNKLVSIGWGKAETQFQGKDGKLPPPPPPLPPRTTANNEDESTADGVRIVWKETSNAFAISYMCKEEGVRKIKIFDRDGNFLNVTKKLQHGLKAAALNWCPSKPFLVCVQGEATEAVTAAYDHKGQFICFLEENCLPFSKFRLPLPRTTHVSQLFWNRTGKVLACYVVDRAVSKVEESRIILFTFSNSKQYVKQVLTFGCSRVIYSQWDEKVENRLHVFLESGIYRMFEWCFEVNDYHGYGSPLVAVVDGKSIYFSSYHLACKPPGTFTKQLSCSHFINSVLFPRNHQRNRGGDSSMLLPLLLHLDKDRLQLVHCTTTQEEEEEEEDKENEEILFIFRYAESSGGAIKFTTTAEIIPMLWLLPDIVYCSWNRTDGSFFCVSSLHIPSGSCIVRKVMKLSSPMMSVCLSSKKELLIYLENGTVLGYTRNGTLHSTSCIIKEPCPYVEVVVINGCNGTAAVALSEQNNLLINGRVKWTDILEFRWAKPFLVLLARNRLMMIEISFIGVAATAKAKKLRAREIFVRTIEEKSYLLTIIDDKLLLVADRGNLEMISPRPFSAMKIGGKLNNGRYREAFGLLRKQRINLNVLCDHNPKKFYSELTRFLYDIYDPVFLAMFAFDLENSDVANRLFPWKYNHVTRAGAGAGAEKQLTFHSKVATLCDALCKIIENLPDYEKEQFLFPLIVMLVKQNKLTEASKLAIETNQLHTLFQYVVNARTIYEATLLSYNLNYAIRVAEYSNTDPGDYLPFIKNLERMDENYRKFTINNYLGRYEEALQYLAADCNTEASFEECLEYIAEKQLHRKAFEIFRSKLEKNEDGSNRVSLQYKRILILFAEYLFSGGAYEEAVILFEHAGLLDRALMCYSHLRDWRSVELLARHIGYEKASTLSTFRELYNNLRGDAGKAEDAAYVALYLMDDHLLAVKSYLTAQKYAHAVRAAKYAKHTCALNSYVRAALVDETSVIVEKINADLRTIEEHRNRLAEIHDKERKNAADVAEIDDDDGDDAVAADSISVKSASTNYSFTCSSSSSITFSGTSGVASSSKRIRRLEKKLWNLKKGNPREKPSLINALRELILSCEDNFSIQVPDLIGALVSVNEYYLAQSLNVIYASLTQTIESTVSMVWPRNEITEEAGFKDLEIKCPPRFLFNSSLKFIL